MRVQPNSTLRVSHSALALFVCMLLLLPVSAGAQTDPRGHWRTWHTQHFRVYARGENSDIAQIAAREAERAYAALARELIPPRGIVDLVLYDNVDFSNGFTTVTPRNQVGIYLTPPAGEAGLSRYDDWLRLVITHEVTHVFHLDRSAGIWRLMQRGFGRAPGLFPNLYRPGWLTEGIAVYYESRLTEGGRVRGGYHSQVLAAAALDDRWPAPGDANFGTAKWPAGLGPYAFGSRFIDWEAQTFGADVIPKFVESTSRRLWPLTISGPLAHAGGGHLGPGWAGFRDSWKVYRPVEPATLLTRGLRVEPRVQVSADAKWIAYVDADGKRTADVVVRDVSTWAEAGRHAITGEVELTWAGPDLVVAQLEYGVPVEIRSRLYRWSPTRPWRRESRTPRLTRPFLLGLAGVGAVLLGPGSATLVRLSGDSVVPLPAPPADAWSHVAASPDGKWIAGARHARGRWDIVLWPAGRPDEARPLTDDAALDEDPTWTPDGSTVVFVSERLGLPQIFGVRVSSSDALQLTHEPTGAREPSVGADGTLYYSTMLWDGYAVLSRPFQPRAPDVAAKDPSASFTPAPEVAVRATRYSPWQGLGPNWWWPVFHDGGTAGRFLGGVTSAADPVGRLEYRFGLSHSLDNGRWEWGLGLGYTRWASVTLDASASQSWGSGGRLIASNGARYTLDERDVFGSSGATWRWRRWRSDASLRLGAEVERDALVLADTAPVRLPTPTVAGGVASFRVARLDSRALAISSENGIVVNGVYRQRWEMGSSEWTNELHGSVRAFVALPLPGFARWVIAGRVAAAMSGGSGTPRAFGLGGESGGIYAPLTGISVGSGVREFPLRGYPRSPFGFTRVAVAAAELRVPLFIIGRGIPRLPLSLDKASVSLFGDAGNGWDPGDAPDLARYRDIGAELVTDWGLNFDTPLRVRAGVARGLTTWVDGAPGGTRFYLALGSSF